jgi:hypothetical protein
VSDITAPLDLGAVQLGLSGSGAQIIQAAEQPVSRYQVLAGPRTGGYETELTSAHNRKLSVRLEDPSQFTFDLNGLAEEANVLEELQTDVHVRRRDDDGTWRILMRGRLGSTSDDVNEDTHRISCTVLDYRAILSRRVLYSGATLTYTGVDQGEIAWALLAYTQSLPGGHLGIAKGWSGTTPTGRNRDWEFKAGDSVGEMIRKVAEVVDGFDWDIVPTSASAMQMQVWSPNRGTDKGVVLETGGLAVAVRREVNPQSYANAIRYSGADELVPVEATATDIAAEGRWDAVYGDTSLEVQECVDERAAWQLAEAATVRPTYTVVLAEGEWFGPDHIWLGDPVRLILYSGNRRIDTTLRVFALDIDIDDEGTDKVTLTLDRPPLDYTQQPAMIDRRLRNLERR